MCAFEAAIQKSRSVFGARRPAFRGRMNEEPFICKCSKHASSHNQNNVSAACVVKDFIDTPERTGAEL